MQQGIKVRLAETTINAMELTVVCEEFESEHVRIGEGDPLTISLIESVLFMFSSKLSLAPIITESGIVVASKAAEIL